MSLETATPTVLAEAPKGPENVRGLVYMGSAFFVFAAADAQAKFLASSLDPIQVAWTRQLGLLVCVIFLLVAKGPAILKTGAPLLQISRGAVAAISVTLFIYAVKFMPLADAVAVTFIAPFVVTILGALFLGEIVGIHRIGAVFVGLIGTLVVIRPGFGVFHPAVTLVLMAAIAFALRQILSRRLAASDRTATTIVYTSLASSILLTIPLPFVWTTPVSLQQLILLMGMAFCSGVGELLVIRALEIANAVVITPLHYTIIIWATFYGWFIFDQLPDLWTWVGTAIIVATGLYIVARERAAARRLREQYSRQT
jgi:drug/metabolite transporter (DMT)-like permease